MNTGTNFLKIGHRGAMGHEPENTLLSFRRAIETGVDMVELDVHVCKSGELVVIHDEKVDRTTGGKGLVSEKTLAELKTLKTGKGQSIPTLEEIFNFTNGRVAVDIELKGEGTAKPVADTILQYSNKGWDSNLFLVSSFDWEELKKFRQHNSSARVGVLFEKKHDDLFDFAASVAAYSIHVPLREFSMDLMREAKERGLKVFVWTVNDKKDIEQLVKMEVDGIFSNFPDRLTV